jgi:hypothetical protein
VDDPSGPQHRATGKQLIALTGFRFMPPSSGTIFTWL